MSLSGLLHKFEYTLYNYKNTCWWLNKIEYIKYVINFNLDILTGAYIVVTQHLGHY